MKMKSISDMHSGNAAKLRKAAKYVQSTMERLRDPTDKNNAEFVRIWEIVSAALAAPPRNCDKYPTFNDAIRALADKRGWHDAKWDWDSERYCILASWLFATATEKEGGNNAD